MPDQRKTTLSPILRISCYAGLFIFGGIFVAALYFNVSALHTIRSPIVFSLIIYGMPLGFMLFFLYGLTSNRYEWSDESISRRGLFSTTTLRWSGIESIEVKPRSGTKITLVGNDGRRIKINFESFNDTDLLDAIFAQTRRLYPLPITARMPEGTITVDDQSIDAANQKIYFHDVRYVIAYSQFNNFVRVWDGCLIVGKDDMLGITSLMPEYYRIVQAFRENIKNALWLDTNAAGAPEDPRAAYMYYLWKRIHHGLDIKNLFEYGLILIALICVVVLWGLFRHHTKDQIVGNSFYFIGAFVLGMIPMLYHVFRWFKIGGILPELEKNAGEDAHEIKQIILGDGNHV